MLRASLPEEARRTIWYETATGADVVASALLSPRFVVKNRSHAPAIPKRASARLPVAIPCSEPAALGGLIALGVVCIVLQRPVLLVLAGIVTASQVLPSSR